MSLPFQIVNLIPVTRHMPKWGAGEVYEQTSPPEIGPDGQQRPGASLTKGQILWLRGITRLQTQVGRPTTTLLPSSFLSCRFRFYCHLRREDEVMLFDLTTCCHLNDFLSPLSLCQVQVVKTFQEHIAKSPSSQW